MMVEFDVESVDVPAAVTATLDLLIAFGVEITGAQYSAVVALAEAVAVRGDGNA